MAQRNPRSIRLSQEEENRLLYLAEQFNCFVKAGRTAGSPSWQLLVKRLGAGDLFVVEEEKIIAEVEEVEEEEKKEEVAEEEAVSESWHERRNESAGIMESLRVLVEGPSRSGKTTILHNFLSHALRFSWLKVLLLDGKGELSFYRDVEGVTYHGPTETEAWAEKLAAIAEAYPERFAQMFAEGLQQKESSEPGVLVVIDEANHGLGDELDGKIRKAISHSLRMIAGKGGALNDVLWVTVPYIEELPKAVRIHAVARFSMAGKGFFHLSRKGFAPSRGQCHKLPPTEAIEAGELDPELPLSLEFLPNLMGVKEANIRVADIYLILGKSGSGKTHLLRSYQQRHENRVLIDCADTLKNNLTSVAEQCYATPPNQLNTEELFTFASQALGSVKTLLLIDNLDRASAAQAKYILKLIEFAAESVLAAKEPEKPAEERLLLPFRQRASRTSEVQSLSKNEAEYLLDENLPENLENEQAVRRFILQETDNPAELVRLARSVRTGDIEEIRQLRSSSTKKPIEIAFPLLIFALIWFMTWLRLNPSYIGFGMILLIVFRPLVRRSATKMFKRGG